MCQSGLLVSQGYGRGMKYYLPAKKGYDLFSPDNMTTSEDNMTTSEGNMTTSADNMATSKDNVATSEDNVATSPKKRLSKQEMDNLIKVVCTEWISLEDIALQIGKDYNYLRKFIIPRMLKEKVIEMLYPGTPNHPRQQYKIKD